MKELLNAFAFEGDITDIKAYGNGHINDTYIVQTTVMPYIIQKINHHVFQSPEKLMHNYRLITDYLKARIIEQGGDPMRETLTIVKTKDQQDLFRTQDGSYYRAIHFISRSTNLEAVKNTDICYQTGKTFGRFQALLKDFDARLLYETIPDFHHTPKRYATFLSAVENAESDRLSAAKEEIAFIQEHKKDAFALYERHLPLRVTHNDTKLDNILFDQTTQKPLCVIDLDTIMPGFVANDFGDCIRSGATLSAEDETDLNQVTLKLDLYHAYLKGFIAGSAGTLSAAEIASLPVGAKTITLEQAIRFLTDYLEGDHYYKIDYPQHNLIRAKTQIKLVSEMEKYASEIENMLAVYL